MSQKKSSELFYAEIFAQMEKIKNLLEVDEINLGYHFQIQIDPKWSLIVEKCQERASALGYSSEIRAEIWIPKFERVSIIGTNIHQLIAGGLRASFEYIPFVEVGGKKFAQQLKFEKFDNLTLNISFGLALEKEIPESTQSLGNIGANIFRTTEKDMALFFHYPEIFKSGGIFSIGRTKEGLINDRLDLSGPIHLYSLLERIYLAAIGRDPLSCTEDPDNRGEYFSYLPDIISDFKVQLDESKIENGTTIAHSLENSWIAVDSEFCTIGVKIQPITL